MNAVMDAFEDASRPPKRLRGRLAKVAGRLRLRGRVAPPRTDNRGKLKMAALSWMVLYPMVTLLLLATAPVFDGAPLYLRTLAASLVMVPAMIWIVQPRLARIAGLAPKPIPKAPADFCL